jgi:hypothetical protein
LKDTSRGKKGYMTRRSFISHFLNIVANMLVIIIDRAKADGKIEGVVPHLVDSGLSIL